MTRAPAVPHDDEAERSVLSTVMLGLASANGLTPAAFFSPRHQLIFAAMHSIETEGAVADVTTVADRLRSDDMLDEVGGLDALHELQNLTPSVSAFPQHVEIIERHARHRRLVLRSDELGRAANAGDDERIRSLLEDLVALRGESSSVDPSFEPVDVAAVLEGELVPIEPSILRRDDGQCLFYVGQVNGVHGDSGAGKGWVVLLAVVQQLTAGRYVLVVDTEDVVDSIVARLRQLGATDTAIRDRLLYVRPTAPFDDDAVRRLEQIVVEHRVSLVVIDSLGECFGLDAIDEDHDAEVGPWLRRVARRLADAGPAVVLVDHSTKASDNPLHPSGSKRKRAAIGGASYFADATTPFTRDRGGRLRLACAKDRHGTYARSEHVADLVMTIDVAGCRTVLWAPDPASVSAEMPIILAARSAVAAVKVETTPITTRALVSKMAIKAGTETKRAGIDLAVSRGAIAEADGPRRATLYSYIGELPEPEIED